ncbi:MAG TPA: hypothetical protein VER58_06600 [Thermoanaerobaculia bacterium]|nr:hypothetical protein [Thermoanaerobaculia bacterium]
MAEQREAKPAVAIGCVAIFTSPLWGTGIYQIVDMARRGLISDGYFLPFLTCVGLIVVGVVPILLTVAGIKAEPQRKAFYKEIRAIPAHWKPQRSAGRLVDQTVETGSVINTMTMVWAGFSLVFGFFAFVAVRQGAWAGLALLVVPLVLVGFVVAKIRGGMRRKRFGKSELALDETPAHIGETLRANLIVEKLRPETLTSQTFKIVVTSIRRRRWTERYHGSTSTRTDSTVLWQKSTEVRGGSGHLKEDGLWLPVAMEIPRDQQPTNDALEDDVIYWQLEAMASLPGIDYYSRFEIPVFAR